MPADWNTNRLFPLLLGDNVLYLNAMATTEKTLLYVSTDFFLCMQDLKGLDQDLEINPRLSIC